VLGPRAIAAYNLARYVNLRVIDRDRVPRVGPAILAARHYHHLFDGAALLMGFRRQPYLFVALDWTRSVGQRRMMESACRLAEWPVALRVDNLKSSAESAYARREVRRYVRTSLASGARLLERGKLLAIFPEGYPTIDPAGSRKPDDDAYLPFAPGVVAIAERAERTLGVAIPILPVGFHYRPAAKGRFDVTMRVGEPLARSANASRSAVIADLEARVRALSE
jgi:1-acyl-sn-glycerol-3-phosphate acyltransferase